MNYYSALYIPQNKIKEMPVDNNAKSRIQRTLSGALKKAKINPLQYNLHNLSKNMTIMAATELTQRYAAGAVSKIISGEPITSRTVLDTLFNTYAPAFNGMLEQMGYNNITQMYDAARAGTLNVPNFLNGFSRTLAVVTETFFNDYKIDRYGEELPIDVVEEFVSEYKNEVAVHPYSEPLDIRDYIKKVGKVTIKLKAHVRNNTAEIWSIGDFSNKLRDAMDQKKFVIFRIGKTIYENVIIARYKPIISNIYDLYFEMDLVYNRFLGRESRRNSRGYHIINAGLNRDLMNMLASEEYIGQGKVEELTIEDTGLIEGIKKVLNRTTIKVQGQDV